MLSTSDSTLCHGLTAEALLEDTTPKKSVYAPTPVCTVTFLALCSRPVPLLLCSPWLSSLAEFPTSSSGH